MAWSRKLPSISEKRAFKAACAHADANPENVPYKTMAARYIPEIDDIPDCLAGLTNTLEEITMSAFKDGFMAGARSARASAAAKARHRKGLD